MDEAEGDDEEDDEDDDDASSSDGDDARTATATATAATVTEPATGARSRAGGGDEASVAPSVDADTLARLQGAPLHCRCCPNLRLLAACARACPACR